MKYKIKVTYRTGDSFGSEETFTILDLVWNNLDVVKENLKAIREHWTNLYEPLIFSYKNNRDKVLENVRNEWWFVSDKEFPINYHYLMNLKTDDGNLMQQRNPWCGYFESLICAEIITVKSDMKFTI